MRGNHPMASVQPRPRADAAHLVFDAEDDMRKVRDLALIVHDHMTGKQVITAEMQSALSWLTCELVEIGERLHTRFDAIFAATHGKH